MDSKTKFWCITITLSVALATSLIAMSFGSVEPTEYAIKYNVISKNVDHENIYEGGLQWIGLFNNFVTYPRIHTSIEFSDNQEAQTKPLQSRTFEGLELTLHFAFQYALIKEDLPKLYRLTEDTYEELFEKIARNVILLQAGEYTAPQYWQNRSYVAEEMRKSLDEMLQQAYARCTGFMMLRIDLPDSYENAIVDTQVVNQQISTQQAVSQATLIRT